MELRVTDRIEINPGVMQGKPVNMGTRIPVEILLRKLAEGAAIEDLLDADDIRAALAYAQIPVSLAHTLSRG